MTACEAYEKRVHDKIDHFAGHPKYAWVRAYANEALGKPYHITANHLLDKEKLWTRDCRRHEDPYRISWQPA